MAGKKQRREPTTVETDETALPGEDGSVERLVAIIEREEDRLRRPPTHSMDRYFDQPPDIREVGYSTRTRFQMVFLIATGDYTYKQIGARYGRDENAMKKFAFDNKQAIHVQRLKLYRNLELYASGRREYAERVLKQIIDETNLILADLAGAANNLDMRFLTNQSAWLNFHTAWCRYRKLQADVVKQLMDMPEKERRRVQEKLVDSDDLFGRVCPKCHDEEPLEEPARVQHGAHTSQARMPLGA